MGYGREKREKMCCVVFLIEKKENVNVWLCLSWFGRLKLMTPPLDIFFFKPTNQIILL